MTLLVDTSVWSLALRRDAPTSEPEVHLLKEALLGADFVFVGRPFLYAAAVGGEPGVRHAITLLWEEIHRNMAMLGITDLRQMTPDMLMRVRG